jgi:hypothetical protein
MESMHTAQCPPRQPEHELRSLVIAYRREFFGSNGVVSGAKSTKKTGRFNGRVMMVGDKGVRG